MNTDGNAALKLDELEPTDWQEMHSPTETVMVKIDQKRRREQCRRRKQDARLWEAIEEVPNGERAVYWIVGGYQAATGPVNTASSIMDLLMKISRSTGTASSDESEWAEKQGKMISALHEWGKECLKRGVSFAACMDIIGHGMGLREVDALRRKQNGWSRQNLVDGISLFVELQGW